jgi:hypothetical protein
MQTFVGFWGVLRSFWAGVLFSTLYGACLFMFVDWKHGATIAAEATSFFIFEYGGLLTGTACAAVWLISIFVLPAVPQLIEQAVSNDEIAPTRYTHWRTYFESKRLGLVQFSVFFIIGLVIYSLLRFPVDETAYPFFLVYSSIQYAFGGFIGRKLWCIGLMLRSLEEVEPRSDLLESEAFPRLIYLVNIFTFLTLVMVAVHTFFHINFDYAATSDVSILLSPLAYALVVLAIPILVLFNFYPRMVVNKLYLKSIRLKKAWLAEKIEESNESEIAKMKHTIDYEKYLSEEFRYRQKVALSELPVALTIVTALVIAAIRVVAG